MEVAEFNNKFSLTRKFNCNDANYWCKLELVDQIEIYTNSTGWFRVILKVFTKCLKPAWTHDGLTILCDTKNI